MDIVKPPRRSKIAISFAILFSITGLAKLLTLFSRERIFELADPVFGVEFRYLLPLVGALELVVALCCLLAEPHKACFVVAWVTTTFVIYRCGVWLTGLREPCLCLGSLTGILHIAPQMADAAMKITLGYMAFSSYGSLLWHLKCHESERRLKVLAHEN